MTRLISGFFATIAVLAVAACGDDPAATPAPASDVAQAGTDSAGQDAGAGDAVHAADAGPADGGGLDAAPTDTATDTAADTDLLDAAADVASNADAASTDVTTPDADFGDTGKTDDASGTDAADSTDTNDTADVAMATTCTSAQWASCDDGMACTSDYCHPQNGCHHLSDGGCATAACATFAAAHGFDSAIEWGFRVVELSGGSLLMVGATDDQGTLVARSAAGTLEWTLKFGSGVTSGFEGVSLRDDGLMWLIGTRKTAGKPKIGWLVRMKQDGKAGLEFAEVDDKHDITLSDAVPFGAGGVVAIGSRSAVAGGKTEGLLLWRDAEGKATGQQEAKIAIGNQTTLRSAWRHASDGLMVCGAAGGVLVARVADTGAVNPKVYSGPKIGSVCRDIGVTSDAKTVLVSADSSGAAALLVVAENLDLQATWTYDAATLRWASSVAPIPGGDVIVAGRTDTDKAPVATLLRVEPKTGDVKWKRTYGGFDSEFNDVRTLKDGTFAAAGALELGDTYKGWLVRTNKDGSLGCTP